MQIQINGIQLPNRGIQNLIKLKIAFRTILQNELIKMQFISLQPQLKCNKVDFDRKQRRKCQLFLLIVIITMLIPSTQCINFKQLVVSAQSYTIQATTKYTILYDRTQQNFGIPIDPTTLPVPALSTVTLTFPLVYTIDNTLSISYVINSGPLQSTTYTRNGNTITISGLFTSSTIVYNLTLVIQNVKNPSPAYVTDPFAGTIGADYAEPISLNSIVFLEPAKFTQCYMTFNPKYVNRTSSMVFSIVAKTTTPLDAGLEVEFAANYWSEGVSTSTNNNLPITSSMACGSLSSNIKPTIQCKGTTNQNRVTVTNMFVGVINAGDTFSFEIKNFLSPPTNRPADIIKITSHDAAGNRINVCSEYVTDLIPNELPASKITITNGGLPLTVNQQYTIRFMFQTIDAFALTDYFEIQFPAGSIFTINTNVLTGGITLVKTSATFINNILRCYMNPLLSVKNYTAPFTMYIAAGTYTAPPSIQPTNNFKISILRNGYPMQVGYQALTPIASTLVSGTVSRFSQVVNRVTTFTFSITISDSLSQTGKIRIKFPAQLTILTQPGSCGSLTGINLADTPQCTISPTSRTIEFTSLALPTATVIPPQTLTLVVNNIANPTSVAMTSTFEVRTFYKATDASLVAVGSINGFLSKEATIDPAMVTVAATSYKVQEQGVSYSIQLTVENEIEAGGQVSLFVPKPILLNTAVLSTSCKRGINTLTASTTPCTLTSQDSSGYLIKFTNPFQSIGVTKNQFLLLQLNSLATNPPSTSPVSTFKLYTVSATNNAIAKIQSSLSIQMIDPTTLTATYARDSQKNFDMTNYQFTLKQVPVMEPSSVVTITFPPEIIPDVSSQCGMIAPFVAVNLVCTLTTPSILRVTLPSSSSISSDTPLTITVTKVRNPTSFNSPGDFTIKTFTSGATYKYASGTTSNKLANTIASSFKQVSGTYTPGILDTDISLSISFQPGVQTPSSIQVSIPSYFTVPVKLECSQVANFNGVCTNPTTRSITVSGSFQSTGVITFQISGFKSTIRPPTSTEYLLITSFTSGGYQLDYSDNQGLFALDCTMPCRTCDTAISKSHCKDCYSSTLITDRVMFDSVTNSCYSTCPDGKYQNQVTKICEDCDSNCLTCEMSATFCTTCKQSTAQKYLSIISVTQQKCVSQCQQFYYPDTTKTPPTCVTCSVPCKTCTSLNFCLTCAPTYFFWQNTCTRDCPIGTTVADLTTGNCQLCSTNCLTCDTLFDKCTSCQSPLILYNNKCLTQCLSPLVYIPLIATCGPCQTKCKTCDKVAGNCTSCDQMSDFKYFWINDCLKSCPDMYYEVPWTCASCSALNMNCQYCVSATVCEKCDAGFVFFDGKCLTEAPPGYVDIGGVAQPCTPDCATCVNDRTTCKSCLTLNLLGTVCQATCPPTTLPINKKCTPCSLTCKTCAQTLNNCTSCDPNSDPELYLIQSRCEIDCPVFFYPDNTTNKCQPCMTPCKKCFDLVTCQTCDQGYFLYQSTSCKLTCPVGYIGINKICQPCTPPCKSCQDSQTKCLTCQPGHFYLKSTNRCLQDCGQGLYEEYLNQTCISCSAPCKTCTNTTNTCLSCITGILYNNVCITECPKKMYNDTNVCQDCPAECSSCTSKVTCTNCTSPLVLYSSFCINKCPDTHAVILAGQCTKCSATNCHKCYDNDLCYSCDSDFSLLSGACLSICPVGYTTNGTHCNQVITSVLQSSNSNMFPVPFTIASCVVLMACLMSKLQNYRTFVSGAIYSLVGVIETLALLYYIYLYYIGYYAQHQIGMYVALGALGMLYLLNVLSFVQAIVLCYDRKFTQWKDGSALNKVFNFVANLVGMMVSHKFKNLMFSRLFSFNMFSAMMDDVKKFKIFNIFSFISLIHSGGAIFSVITIIKTADPKTQFFHSCLDVLIVTSVNIIFAFFNAFKQQNYFDQVTPQGLLLHKKIFGDEDSYNGKISVDGNDMENEEGQGYYSKIQHTLASNQAFRFKDSDESRVDLQSGYSDSMTNIAEKEYEEVSVQACQILQEKDKTQNKIDFSTLKVDNDQANSKFTTIFQNQDKSIQNTIDYDKKVDYSVQKNQSKIVNDMSIQHMPPTANQDISVQYSNNMRPQFNDISIQHTQKANQDISVQHSEPSYMRRHDISVQDSFNNHLRDQSGQYSFLQSQKGVQNIILLHDRSIQQQPNHKQWSGQNTIQVKDFSIQKEQQRVQYDQINQSLNNQTTVKNNNSLSDNIFYIDQQQQQGNVGEQSYNMLQVRENDGKVMEGNKKTIMRQQLPKPQLEEFDLPRNDIQSYEEELESKILLKQRQLEAIRKEIEAKERETQLKERLMREESERLQRENQDQKEKERVRDEEVKREKEQMERDIIQAKSKIKPQTQTDDKFTMMRMTQLIDNATHMTHTIQSGRQSTPHNNPSTLAQPRQTHQQATGMYNTLESQKTDKAISNPKSLIADKSIRETGTMMRMTEQVDEGTGMEDLVLLQNSTKVVEVQPNYRQVERYEVDMNRYVKENRGQDGQDEQQLSESNKSTRTRTKPRRNPQAKQHSHRPNLQPEHPSQQPPTYHQQQVIEESQSPSRKQPGRIRLVDDSRKKEGQRQLEEEKEEVTQFDKTQNYIYEVEDVQLRQQQESGDITSLYNNNYNNESSVLTNKPPVPNPNPTQYSSPSYQQLPLKQPNYILDESNANHQLIQNHQHQNIELIQNLNEEIIDDDSFNDHSRDIPMGIVEGKRRGNRGELMSDVVDSSNGIGNKRTKILSKGQQLTVLQPDDQQVIDHEQLKREFNQSRKNLPRNNSSKKQLPQQHKQTLHVNINKLTSYTAPQNIPKPSPQKKPSSSLLLTAKNLIDSQNQQLARKSSQSKNPLVTNKKWQHQNEHQSKPNNLSSIEQSSQANDSLMFSREKTFQNNVRNTKRHVPDETDRGETSFAYTVAKVGSSNNVMMNPNRQMESKPSSKSFTQELSSSKRKKTSSKHIPTNEQVQVHFETKPQVMRHDPSSSIPQPRIQGVQNKRNASRQRPTTTASNMHPPTKPSLIQFQSQQIFGEAHNPSQYYQQQQQYPSYHQPSGASKHHRNNLLMDKLMDRPQNDDLYQYYNRASTHKGSKRNSQQRKSQHKINLSKDKPQGQKKLQKVYMQRLDSSLNKNRANSRGRYQ